MPKKQRGEKKPLLEVLADLLLDDLMGSFKISLVLEQAIKQLHGGTKLPKDHEITMTDSTVLQGGGSSSEVDAMHVDGENTTTIVEPLAEQIAKGAKGLGKGTPHRPLTLRTPQSQKKTQTQIQRQLYETFQWILGSLCVNFLSDHLDEPALGEGSYEPLTMMVQDFLNGEDSLVCKAGTLFPDIPHTVLRAIELMGKAVDHQQELSVTELHACMVGVRDLAQALGPGLSRGQSDSAEGLVEFTREICERITQTRKAIQNSDKIETEEHRKALDFGCDAGLIE